ncbi:MAG: Gfo/Idh/MocA family oxidoreductase, partial [Rhizobiales bacterium]|nr:Gfo/Idh/MocA family oxidoreductase [Hyphomicrobiales bacterium]
AIDGVYIPLPTSQHLEWAIRAADAGKHVLVEKPLALKADDIAAVIAARERNGVVVSEAFMVVHHPQWVKVKELVGSGAIGRLRHVQGAFSYFLKDPANMRNIPALGGGGLPDIGVYPTVSTRFVTGSEPKRLRATVERDKTFGTDIYSVIHADFGDFDLSFYIATQLAARQVMVFHGDEGFIEIRSPFNAGLYDDHRIEINNARHDEARILRFPGTHQYRLQAEAFVRATRGETGRIFTLEDSVKNQRVIDAIYASAEAGGWVEV